ncbi:ATP synthase mitochondrial F1 complex assembly factor 1-like [Babylonia areolata]|uniref:ATP synthase mitochondrial F1 complex assembly factor 1-like n=1 Tax=Babylonia areolata TaxID=304850 RepID=UPI003FD60164
MSEMPGQRELLNICFACLRYSRVAQSGLPLVRPPSVGNVFLKGRTQCSQCHFASSEQGPGGRKEEAKNDDDSIVNNPFYEKYKQKLQHLAQSDPDEFKFRLQQLEEEKKPKRSSPPSTPADGEAKSSAPATPQPIPRSASYSPAKGLDSLMKLELIQDKSAEEVEQIWKEYHKTKDCVFAVLQKEAFEDLMSKGQSCPTFIFPLPRDDGHEFILMQFDGKDVQFTPLAMYQMLKENAPACLTLMHYTELMDSKGIVLMSGQYDDKVLKREDAVMIVQMMAIYFGKNSPRFDLVKTFNHQPDAFDYNHLIEDFNNMYLDKAPLQKSSTESKE